MAGPTTLRVPQVVDRSEGLLLACGDDLCGGRGSDPRQRVEDVGGRPVQIDEPAGGGAVCRTRAGFAGIGIVASRDADLVAVPDWGGKVQRPVRATDVDPWPEPARGLDRVADA